MNRTLPELHTESRKFPRRLPIPVLVIYGLALLTGGIHLAAMLLPAFADRFNRYIGAAVRGALAYVTVWIPFSFAEFLLLALPIIFAVMLRRALPRYGDSWKSVLRYCAGLLALLFMSFTIGFDIGIVLAKGILISMITVFLFMPAVISLFSGAIEKTRRKPMVIPVIMEN